MNLKDFEKHMKYKYYGGKGSRDLMFKNRSNCNFFVAYNNPISDTDSTYIYNGYLSYQDFTTQTQYNDLPNDKKLFLEILHDEIVPYFDFDMGDTSDIPGFISDIITVFERFLNSISFPKCDNKYYIKNACKDNKFSLQFIVRNKFKYKNPQEFKIFAIAFAEYLKKNSDIIMDTSIYSNDHLLRMLGSDKAIKKYGPRPYVKYNYTDEKDEMFLASYVLPDDELINPANFIFKQEKKEFK